MLTDLHPGRPGDAAVVAFPHAGGSPRFFHHWARVLPATRLLGVTYPGRDDRIDDSYADGPFGADLLGLAREAADALVRAGLETSVLFGHSLGAYIAYETAAALTRAGAAGVRVAVSGQNPPDRRPTTALHRAGDAALIADIVRQNPGSAPLWEDEALRAMFLPAVREDYRVLETYVPSATVVAEMLVCSGDRDPEVVLDGLGEWRRYALRSHPLVVLSGDHFYLRAPDERLPRTLAARFGLR